MHDLGHTDPYRMPYLRRASRHVSPKDVENVVQSGVKPEGDSRTNCPTRSSRHEPLKGCLETMKLRHYSRLHHLIDISIITEVSSGPIALMLAFDNLWDLNS